MNAKFQQWPLGARSTKNRQKRKRLEKNMIGLGRPDKIEKNTPGSCNLHAASKNNQNQWNCNKISERTITIDELAIRINEIIIRINERAMEINEIATHINEVAITINEIAMKYK